MEVFPSDEVNNYINEVIKREYRVFKNEDEIVDYFNDYMNELYKRVSFKEMKDFYLYTGYSFRNINAVFRGNWNYHYNGSKDNISNYKDICDRIENVFTKLPPVPGNIKVFRGVDIEPFREYGINSIKELPNIKGKCIVEEGLTSTSLIESKCFHNQEIEYHSKCNILIEYYVPEECDDAIALLTGDLSSAEAQEEVLFAPSSLVKVVDVKINEDGTEATLKAIYIPVRIWDPNRKQVMDEIKR